MLRREMPEMSSGEMAEERRDLQLGVIKEGDIVAVFLVWRDSSEMHFGI